MNSPHSSQIWLAASTLVFDLLNLIPLRPSDRGLFLFEDVGMSRVALFKL